MSCVPWAMLDGQRPALILQANVGDPLWYVQAHGSPQWIEQRRLVPLINTFVGIPWKEDGRDARGIDCIGTQLLLWGLRLGHAVEDPRKSLERAALQREPLNRIAPQGWVEIDPGEAKPWDAIQTGLAEGRGVAIVGEAGYALTALRGVGSTLQRARDVLRVARSAWRYPWAA